MSRPEIFLGVFSAALRIGRARRDLAVSAAVVSSEVGTEGLVTFKLSLLFPPPFRLALSPTGLCPADESKRPPKMAAGPYNYSYIFKYIIIGELNSKMSILMKYWVRKKRFCVVVKKQVIVHECL